MVRETRTMAGRPGGSWDTNHRVFVKKDRNKVDTSFLSDTHAYYLGKSLDLSVTRILPAGRTYA
jgi:hypothetical protein